MKESPLKIAEFFTSEYRRMVYYVRSIIDDASERSSEDIVQDVFTGIFEAADISRPIENLSAYIYRSLKNRVIDVMRSRKKTLSLDAPDPETGLSPGNIIEDNRCDTEYRVINEALREALFAAIDRLPDDQRAIVIMTEFEGMTYRRISMETGIPLGTLLSRKSRALDSIRAEIKKFDYLLEK